MKSREIKPNSCSISSLKLLETIESFLDQGYVYATVLLFLFPDDDVHHHTTNMLQKWL
jgi:hypothetical protein